MFDLICGTSTGGMIALSQLKNPPKSLPEIRDTYLGIGREVYTYHLQRKYKIWSTNFERGTFQERLI